MLKLQVIFHLKKKIPDSQQYHLNLYLIKNAISSFYFYTISSIMFLKKMCSSLFAIWGVYSNPLLQSRDVSILR